jgi:hypothetical protein
LTLNILDQYGNIVDPDNPIIIEHNGTKGGEVVVRLRLKNTSSNHYHRNIVMMVNEIKPVDSSLMVQGEQVPYYLREKRVPRLDPTQEVTFFLRTIIPKGVTERLVTGIFIFLSSMRYPLS